MAKGRAFIGTSGWTYDDWSGAFYPPGVSGAERLAFYAQRFNTVEVNATFYRLPTPAMIKAWNKRLPSGFHLVLKGSRFITHRKKLTDIAEPLEKFWSRARQLERLKVVLWQLHPSLQRDLPRLEDFLAQLPAQVGHTVEFRHASWWHDETYALLEKYGAAFCAISHPELPSEVPVTADFLYLRFHGEGKNLYRYDYSDHELADWAERVEPHLEGRDLYAFFNNDHEAKAVFNAQTFQELLAEQIG
ncbi:MAG: DUF72 domain-containing protein [Deltaproteobacteria bacterium]|nr:DUF72 domain-containing protein [Deltaproteobacteria bacterium]